MPLQIIMRDITEISVDAIVNTTNEKMIGYSGVDFAVHKKAGIELDKECSALVPLGLGQAVITNGYKLPCKYVIHTSVPVWNGGLRGEEVILRSCYIESLKLAVKHGCESVAVPLIGTGICGYPKERILKFALRIIKEFLFENELTVYICVFDKESYSFSRVLFDDISKFIDDRTLRERLNLSDKANLEYALFRHEEPKRKRRIEFSEDESEAAKKLSLREYIKNTDKSFGEMLFDLIDQSGMTDVECYKRANVDKRTFSKIKSNKEYRPSKQTAIAFAIALELDLEQTQALLASVGFTLSQSSVFDKIIRYFIYNENYDILEINEALFEFDQALLGSGL